VVLLVVLLVLLTFKFAEFTTVDVALSLVRCLVGGLVNGVASALVRK
jgi:hypothetical protein